MEAIQAYWATSLSGLSKSEAKMSFLEKMKEWSLFGSSFFEAEFSRKPKHVLIAINKDGFFVLNNTSPVLQTLRLFLSFFNFFVSEKRSCPLLLLE